MTTYSKLTRDERDDFHQRANQARLNWGIEPSDYRRLAAINHTLHQWYEQKCNGEIERDEETDKVYRCYGINRPGEEIRRLPARDLETGAVARAKAIATRYQGWIYLQTDPRGVAVYFFRKGAQPGPRTIGRDEKVSQVYSTKALACYF